jgi:YnbE-like lipoprotein
MLALAFMATTAACQPRVAIEAPKDPIVINLNVKIEQEVRVKVERDVDDLFADNKDLF